MAVDPFGSDYSSQFGPLDYLVTAWPQPQAQPPTALRAPQSAGPVAPPYIVSSVAGWSQPPWLQSPSQPVARPSSLAAAMASSGTAGSPYPLAAAAAPVTLDRWFQPSVQPPSAPRRLIQAVDASGGAVASPAPLAAPPEIVLADKWYIAPPQPRTVPAPQQATGITAPPAGETVLVSEWLSPQVQPVAGRGAPQSTGQIAPPAQPPQLALPAIGWLQPAAQPNPQPSRGTALATGSVFAASPIVAPPETVTLDKWFQPLSQPASLAPVRLGANGPTSLPLNLVSEIVLADKWMQPASQPVSRSNRSASLATSGAFGSLLPPLANAIATGVFGSDYSSQFGPGGVAGGWLQPQIQPLAARSLPQSGGSFAPLLPASAMAVDPFGSDYSSQFGPLDYLVTAWPQPQAMPPTALRAPQSAGPVAPFLGASAVPAAENVTMDKWHRPVAQPALAQSRLAAMQASGINLPPGNFAPELVTMDKWFQQPVMPRGHRLARQAAHGASVPLRTVVSPPQPPPTRKNRAIVTWMD